MNVAATGVLRANAKWLYWKDRLPRVESTALLVPTISLNEVFEICRRNFSEDVSIQRVELKTLLHKQVYMVKVNRKENSRILLDAASGRVLSPIDSSFAVEIARSFVDEKTRVAFTENSPSFKARKSSEPRPAFHIVFDDPVKTEIFIDRDTGDMLLVLDRGRRFGLWVAKLHELDFAGISQAALSVLGFSMISLSLTGVFLANQNKRRSV